MAKFDEDIDFEDDEFFESDEDEDSEDGEGVDLDNLQQLLDEGLEARKPKRNMNPNSLANLKKGGVGENIKRDKITKREQNIQKRIDKMKDDPLDYYRNALIRNLVQEEFNLEELQEDLASELSKQNQQKIRGMIYSTTQTLLLLGDALKAQPKQNKVDTIKSISTLAEKFEEFRKTLPAELANDARLFEQEMERMRSEYADNLEKGETK